LADDGRGGSDRSPPPKSGAAKTASRAPDALSVESRETDGPPPTPLLAVGVGLDRECEKQVT